jgi:hypothetical protein
MLLTIDEAPYAPALFSELKRAVDGLRRQRRLGRGAPTSFDIC